MLNAGHVIQNYGCFCFSVNLYFKVKEAPLDAPDVHTKLLIDK